MLEGVVEEAALEYFRAIGYSTKYGPEIAPGGSAVERADWDQVVLIERLRAAVRKLNPELTNDAVDDVVSTVLRTESQSAIAENWRVHRLITEGVAVSYRTLSGEIRHELAWLVDFQYPLRNNDLLVVNQFTVVQEGKKRRPDLLVFINGIPLGLVELKNPGDENATLLGAWNQIQTYKTDIPAIFTPNAVCVASDGILAAMGSFAAPWEHFSPWKTIEGRELAPAAIPQLEVLIKGAFEPARFLDLIRHFIVFADEDSGPTKKVAKYHQYWAVTAAIESTVAAARPDGDRRGGVVWHTQGSGKSLEMVFYANKVMRDTRMRNPTLVFITDRNDLDDQLHDEVFAPVRNLPERPQRAESRRDLRRLLDRQSGGIIFTTVQKFVPDEKGDVHPLLTDRRNVVVVADEAHRSQYDFIDGFARHLRDALPNATYLGFTGTPIEATDRSTKQVFGDYIDIYDLTRAVEDGATVRIYYESRLAKVALAEDAKKNLDEVVEVLTEAEEASSARRLKSKWARVEAIVGADERLAIVAQDIVGHWERRRSALEGKGMIVCMSRRICVELYKEIRALRPDWHSDEDAGGKIKVIITGSAMDPPAFQPHIRTKAASKALKLRAKKPSDALELVIVRDMWLTGFDSPAMHTMYVDKPMRGHGLMQAIARVNRTFKDKPGGLIVDYIGIAQSLRDALADYSPTDREQAGIPIEEAIEVMQEKHDIVTSILYGHVWNSSPRLPPAERVAQLAAAIDFVLGNPDLKARFMDQSLALVKAFALCGSRDEAMEIRDDVAFFTGVRASITKLEQSGTPGGAKGKVELETAIAQLVSQAVAADQVLDIYAAAGMERPDISILSDEFLDQIRRMPQRNLQMELLRKLLNDEIRALGKRNVVQQRKFSEMLEVAIRKYQNRALDSAEIIAELVNLAKEMREAKARGEKLGLNEAELAFYDAVCQNDSAILGMGDDLLKQIAHELVATVQQSATIDWNLKASVQAGLRARVRRLLAKHGYPPDKAERAVQLIFEQAELFANELAA